MKSVLIIDNESAIRDSYADHLEDRDFEVYQAENGLRGIGLLSEFIPDVVLLDLWMPEMDGIEVLSEIKKVRDDIPVIVISGTGVVHDAIDALKQGAWDFILKPIEDLSVLDHAIDKALEKARLIRENRSYQTQLEEMVEERTKELREATEKLSRSESRHRLLFESSTDPIFLYDPKTDTLIDGNPACLDLFEIDEKEALHALYFVSLFQESQPDHTTAASLLSFLLDSCLDRGVCQRSCVMKTIVGNAFDAVVTMTRFQVGADFLIQLHVRDVSAQKAAERAKSSTMQALVEAKEHAEQANRAKDEFLAVMSHEMRTPLNPILGLSELMREMHTEEPESTYLDTIIRSANRQLELIDDILSYTKMDRGNMDPRFEEFCLMDLCRNCLDDARHVAHALALHFDNGDEGEAIPADLIVNGEQSMLQRILDNLLANACKYTERGSVTLSVGMTLRLHASSIFHFSVTDTGIGIDPDVQNGLFEPFTQADYSHTRQFEGAGLGLAICRKLVDFLGGEIEVKSQVDKGSRFSFNVPMRVVKGSAKAESSFREPGELSFEKTIKMLVVDDAPDNVRIAQILLERMGAKVEAASNGQEALKLTSTRPYDIILMDVSMPVMDGIRACRLIRASQGINGETPIIAITASVSLDVREECIEAGMNDFLAKPFQKQKLFELIHELIAPAV